MLYYTTLTAENSEELVRRYFNRGWVVRLGPKPNEVVIYAASFSEIFTELLEVHGCNEDTISREKVIQIANLVNRL